MKTVNDGSGGTKYGARVIALILLAGGLLGLLGSALSVYHSFPQHRTAAGVSGRDLDSLVRMVHTHRRRTLANNPQRVQMGQTTVRHAGSRLHHRSVFV